MTDTRIDPPQPIRFEKKNTRRSYPERAASTGGPFEPYRTGDQPAMGAKAAITVNKAREEVERLWKSPGYRPEYIDDADAGVRFAKAPGDRGTEIHVDVDPGSRAGKLGEVFKKAVGSDPRAKVMDDLRRFKQLVETGEITRSEGAPEGELAERKLKQRPAQPLDDSELEKAGV